MKRKILIGVAWPYVNGDLHIGHLAGYLLPADILARFQRITGNDVLMVSGSDCFGTPITVEADKRKVLPKDIVDEYHNKDTELFKDILNLSYDMYTRTDHKNHIEVVQNIFVKMLENDHIFVNTTEQYYSPKEAKFLPDRYVTGTCPNCGFNDSRSDQCDNCGKLIEHGTLINPVSNLTKDAVELKESDHYFINWPKLQPQLKEYVNKNVKNWKDWVGKETLGWLEEGLLPRAITRDISWGVPIPKDRIPENKLISNIDEKRIYVWFDAVIGYLSASILWSKEIGEKKKMDWQDFWYDLKTGGNSKEVKHYYFMGKDNLVFHTLFWPGQLMSYDTKLHLPDVVSINMFLDLNGKQFSKSRGVSIGIREMVEEFGNDPVRFYLTLIMPEVRDSSFKWSDFEEKVNGILVANLGNFIHRVLSIGKDADIDEIIKVEISDETAAKIEEAFGSARTLVENCEFRSYLGKILELSAYGNGLVDSEKLWELKKSDQKRFIQVMAQLYMVIIALRYLIEPLIPDAAKKLGGFMNLTEDNWPEVKKADLFVGEKLKLIKLSADIEPLFKKIEGVSERDL